MESKLIWINLIVLIFSFSSSIADSDNNSVYTISKFCVYTIYIRTGTIIKGGTDSIISLELYDNSGDGIGITDLESWGGLMGPGHDYYERGNLDIFSGRGPCLNAPICAAKLISDGTGPHPGWYVNYVEVTSTGPHVSCAQQLFTVEQWLALDVAPYELTAFRDNCENDDDVELKLTPVNSLGSKLIA